MKRQELFLAIQFYTTNLNATKMITSWKGTNLYCFCFNQISHGDQLQKHLVNATHSRFQNTTNS